MAHTGVHAATLLVGAAFHELDSDKCIDLGIGLMLGMYFAKYQTDRATAITKVLESEEADADVPKRLTAEVSMYFDMLFPNWQQGDMRMTDAIEKLMGVAHD